MSPPSTKKKKPRKTIEPEPQGEDRISALPDELLHQILKFVDTKLGVQTCVLSKRWKFVWTSLPFLTLRSCPQFHTKKATNFARNVLKHRNHQSGLSFLEVAYLPPGLVDKFIDYAVSRNVEDLNVYLQSNHKPFKWSKFSCNSITNLVVRMKIVDASEFDSWDLPALRKLLLWLLPKSGGNGVLPVECLTCLPALRDLTLMLWDFRDPAIELSLPELTTLDLSLCKMPGKIWNLPALKTLKLVDVDFPGNMNDTIAALVSLQNLTLHRMSMQGCYIRCPQLVNLEIMTYYDDTSNVVVLAPKLTNFTSVGIFPITFEDCELESVHLKLCGWINRANVPRKKEYYQQFISMLPGLCSAKILYLDLGTIEALSSISDFLVSSPSPFYNLEYVKLPRGFKEASLSNILRNYLLGASPIATIVEKLPQNTAATSVTAQNVVIEETLAATNKLGNSKAIQKTVCIDTVNVGVQEELLVQNSEVHADKIMHVGSPVEGTCKDQANSSRGNTDSGLWKGNEVSSEFVCLLDQIMKKYPETFEHFTTKNKKFCTMKLNMLCTAVNDFSKLPMIEVDTEVIVEYRDVFADLKKLGFNVSWLVNRLNYIEQVWFSQPLIPKLHATDCHNNDAKSELQDLQIRIDDAKTKFQDLQTLRFEKMKEIQNAFGNMDTELALGCAGDNLLSDP